MTELPTVELHIHIEGTLEPELIFRLAERNGIKLPYGDIEELRRHYEFIDLQSFLDLYYSNMAVLRTADDFADMTRAYLTRAAAAGVRHAEIMMDPQAHLSRGIPLATSVGAVAEVLAKSESEFGVSTELIAAFLRDRPAEEALAVLDDLLAMEVPIIGIGLDSAERGNPPGNFVAPGPPGNSVSPLNSVPASGRYVVKFKEKAGRSSAGRAHAYGKTAKDLGISVKEVRTTATGAQVIETAAMLDSTASEDLVAGLEANLLDQMVRIYRPPGGEDIDPF